MATALSKAENNALTVSYDVLGTRVELDLEFVKKYLVMGRAELTRERMAYICTTGMKGKRCGINT